MAPFMLTALIERPDRLVYLSSGLHRGGEGSLRDLDWTERPWNPARAYAESKLHVEAANYRPRRQLRKGPVPMIGMVVATALLDL